MDFLKLLVKYSSHIAIAAIFFSLGMVFADSQWLDITSNLQSLCKTPFSR